MILGYFVLQYGTVPVQIVRYLQYHARALFFVMILLTFSLPLELS